MNAPVLVMAGGTGGHVFPGLAVAAALRARDVPVVWLGADGGMEQQLVPKHDIPFRSITVSGVRGKGWRRKLRLPFDLLRSVWQARAVLKAVQPRSVLSLGGYAAGPGGLAARWLRRPLLVHEQNRIPGLTNKVLARFAQRVLTGFPDAFAGRGEWVGNPVRAAISAAARAHAPSTRWCQPHSLGCPTRSGPRCVINAAPRCSMPRWRATRPQASAPRSAPLSTIWRRPMAGRTWCYAAPVR
jgi:UDP-N-acetylglucosamine:LPS N-acetylglucosamine transferase